MRDEHMIVLDILDRSSSNEGSASNTMNYRLHKTSRGDDQLGPCEVCGKAVDGLVWMIVEEREYFSPILGRMSKTKDGCKPNMFGHKKCLKAIRKKEGVQ